MGKELNMQKKQVYNPFLPLNTYIPDGEPHVFGDRLYLYGSHDREGGHTFCMEDYEVFSAPVHDLSDWRSEGVIYRASQDPMYSRYPYMYAPDCVQGNDGRYYLYYCMAGEYGVGGYRNPISVAVCDSPAGKFEYLGHVRNKDGSLMMRYVCFDPAVMNDEGTIRLYYGTQYGFEEEDDFLVSGHLEEEMDMYGRTREEILSYPDSINGPIGCVLEEDMLTIREEPKHIIPYRVKGTDFEEHPFFEASSMRKVGEKYFFVYSSWLNHELCYAVSDHPDRDFRFGGTIVSNGDVGIAGRKEEESLNMTGTTHGSIVEVNGQWYVFYHRLTHKSDYSRQACAEKISITPEGRISQVEITSCGLNEGPLRGEGAYPAVIACNLTNGRMPHGCNCIYAEEFPNVTNAGDERFIAGIEDETLIGYKYFALKSPSFLSVLARVETDENRVVYTGPTRIDVRSGGIAVKPAPGDGGGGDELLLHPRFDVYIAPAGAEDSLTLAGTETGMTSAGVADGLTSAGLKSSSTSVAEAFGVKMYKAAVIRIASNEGGAADGWESYSSDQLLPQGVYAVYLVYHGREKLQLKEISFSKMTYKTG